MWDPCMPFSCAFALLPFLGSTTCSPAQGAVPAFAGEAPSARAEGEETIVLAGGCFWGVDAVYKHVKGVLSAVSGYSGGSAATAQYSTVCSGSTSHAESVKITYNISQIGCSDLLRIFFSVATNPTEVNRQGPDVGTQYRSVIFYTNETQKQTALAYISQLNKAKVFSSPIVTQVVPLEAFYPAEEYHQNYLEHHSANPYIAINDMPKLRELQRLFPGLYKE